MLDHAEQLNDDTSTIAKKAFAMSSVMVDAPAIKTTSNRWMNVTATVELFKIHARCQQSTDAAKRISRDTISINKVANVCHSHTVDAAATKTISIRFEIAKHNANVNKYHKQTLRLVHLFDFYHICFIRT